MSTMQVEELIKAGEANPPIYSAKYASGHINHIKARKEAWEKVFQILGNAEETPELKKMIQTKWRNLKDAFYRTIKLGKDYKFKNQMAFLLKEEAAGETPTKRPRVEVPPSHQDVKGFLVSPEPELLKVPEDQLPQLQAKIREIIREAVPAPAAEWPAAAATPAATGEQSPPDTAADGNLNLDIIHNQFALLYDMYSRFQTAYYGKEAEPLSSKTEFLNFAPLVIIDCSNQNELLKTGPVDVRLEFESHDNFPAETTAYCRIIHDRVADYSPLSGDVIKRV